jgi:hypothetical protein
MDRTSSFVPGLVILILACLLAAGCFGPDTTDQPAPGTTPVTTNAGARYTAGDIVKNPASAVSTAWLVIGYDDASDKYERALVYPNADGSWGYRSDSRTEKADRLVMEKVYTEVVEHKLPSSVPIITPTIITPEETLPATVTTLAAATTTASRAPIITNIIPDKGDAGTTVQVTDLVGDNLVNGANVTLSRSGSSDIRATGVRAVTPKSITCSFAIPADAPAGAWDVVVTNPDGQLYRYTNIFSVHRTSSVVITTAAIHEGGVPISYIDPPVAHTGYTPFTFTGSGFKTGARVYLQRSDKTPIEGTSVRVNSDTQIQCFFDLPPGSNGVWDARILNTDGSYGIWRGGLDVY